MTDIEICKLAEAWAMTARNRGISERDFKDSLYYSAFFFGFHRGAQQVLKHKTVEDSLKELEELKEWHRQEFPNWE